MKNIEAKEMKMGVKDKEDMMDKKMEKTPGKKGKGPVKMPAAMMSRGMAGKAKC